MESYRYDINQASIDSPRTMFRIPYDHKTTFNAGDLVPVFVDDVLPGDTWSIKLSSVVRELTLLNPVMSNSWIQFDAFFVPWRLIWSHTKQFFGENDTGIWTQTRDYLIPSGKMNLDETSNVIPSCSLGDYMGLPVLREGDTNQEEVSYLPLRAYAEIWNYYYMAETTQAPVLFSKEDNITFGVELSEGYAASPLKVNRFHDLFTSALPQPQKGENVPFLSDYLPVIPIKASTSSLYNKFDESEISSLTWRTLAGAQVSGSTRNVNGDLQISTSGSDVVPNNLFASTVYSSLKDINSLRIAIATQHYYEVLGRTGSRYGEFIKGMFNVDTPSEVINVPQYLGSVKKLINVNQVLSTADNENAILGTTGAFSHTAMSNEKLCVGSFSEFGTLIIMAHVRTDNSYSQGIPKLFSKKSKFDVYTPLFASIGNVPIKNKEIYFSDDQESDNEVFGYAEPWYEYKQKPNLTTGFMRPDAENSFSSWTYGRVFSSKPVLNSDFTTQTDEEVNRTIAVQSNISNQFKMDLFVDCKVSRIMPLYSNPGLKRI